MSKTAYVTIFVLAIFLGSVVVACAIEQGRVARAAESVRDALARDPRFQNVRVEYLQVTPTQGAIGLTGLVERERDAWEARDAAWKALGGGPGVIRGIFMAMKSREPGMSRLGVPWCAVPSSCDGWEQALRFWGPPSVVAAR